MIYISQTISLLINIYISFTEKKRRIYIATFLLNLSQLAVYYINKDITTSLIYAVIATRSLVYIYKDKFKTNAIPYIAIALQLLIGFLTLEKATQILAVLIPCYSSWYLWFYKDTQKLRIGNIIANTGWGIYNIIGGLYIILIMRLMTIISNQIAYIRFKKNMLKKISKKKKIWVEV